MTYIAEIQQRLGAEYRQAKAVKPRRSKYNVADKSKRTWQNDDGTHTVFDSAAEMARWRELYHLEMAGKISKLTRQEKIIIAEPFFARVNGKRRKYAEIAYIVDFCYCENGRWVFEDFKGAQTAIWRVKIKLALSKLYSGQIIRITHADGTREDYMR